MAVAAPARRSQAATAPAPSRTTAPKPQRAPAKRAPAKRAAPKRRAQTAAPARAPQRPRRAPARAPQRARPKTKPRRSTGGQLIPLAVGHTAAAVRHLPDSSLVVRMTRGRAWIAVLGVLLVGIVALNVVTLSFAATAGKVDEANMTLSKENSVLGGREAARNSTARIRGEAAAKGLAMPVLEQPHVINAGPHSVATAAARLAAAASAGG